jgi:uncharacterized membrane-anchored protein
MTQTMKAKRRWPRLPRLHGSYDAFFLGRSRVNPVQFWGLVLVGGNLAVLGIVLLATVVTKVAKPSLDTGEGLILLLGVAICGGIVYFGFLHFRRAFAGRNDKAVRRG